MKKIAKFNPNVRAVGDVLSSNITFAFYPDASRIMRQTALFIRDGENKGSENSIKKELDDVPLATIEMIRHLMPDAIEAMCRTQVKTPLKNHARLQSSVRAETFGDEAVLHVIKAERRPHPILEREGIDQYMTCHFYVYPYRKTDNIRWEIEVFDDATIERLKSYCPNSHRPLSWVSPEAIKSACITYFNHEFGKATNKRSNTSEIALTFQINQFINALGTMSTQAILDEMRERWARGVFALDNMLWSASEKKFLDVPTYPFEFIIDPSQRVTSDHPNRDDCDVWELFVYRVEPNALSSCKIARWSNEDQILQRLDTSVADRKARRHARLSAKYAELAEVLREKRLDSASPSIDIRSSQLGAKIAIDPQIAP